MGILNRLLKPKKEKICKKALIHSSYGEFTIGDKKHSSRLKSGGHGEENIAALKQKGIAYNINIKYPNGVRMGNIPTHKETYKRRENGQCWFPKSWSRKTIKNAGEKVANSIPYKLPNDRTTFGTYKKVKIGIKRTNGKITSVFPYYKQTGGKKK